MEIIKNPLNKNIRHIIIWLLIILTVMMFMIIGASQAWGAGPVWSQMGISGINGVNYCYGTSIVLLNGTPYMAYAEYNGAGVLKYNGTNWTKVGSSLTNDECNNVSMSVYGTTLYVAYSSSDVTVKKFDTASDSDWSSVGIASTSQANSKDSWLSLNINSSSDIYMTYTAYTDSKFRIYHYDGSSWALQLIANTSTGCGTSVNGTAYAAYRNGGAEFRMDKNSGTGWSKIQDLNGPPIAICNDNSGKIYIVTEDINNSYYISVAVYDTVSNVYSILGSNIPYSSVDSPSISVDNGTVYLVFHKNSTAYLYANQNGTDWVQVGSSLTSACYGEMTAYNGVAYYAYSNQYKLAAAQIIYPVPVPKVTMISPAAGPEIGGTLVNITGTNFTGVTAVNFGGTSATSFTVNSSNSIIATAPAGTGTADVTVTSPDGTSSISSNDQFTYCKKPTVTSISPDKGPDTGGTSVDISGTNFSGVTAVNFGALPATSFTINSSTSITATAPAGTGTVDVTVTSPGGTSATDTNDQFTYLKTYTVTFDSLGGSPVDSITDIKTGFNINEPNAPTKPGYVFAGWYKESACTNVWDFTTDTVTGNITLFARWTPKHAVSISVLPPSAGTVTGQGDYAEGAVVMVTAVANSGYVFVNWVDNGGLIKTNSTYSFTMATEDVSLRAIFKAIYTVSIGTTNGGTITASPTNAVAGEDINLTITPTSGNQLKAGTLKYNDGTDHIITGTSFTMPAANVTVTAEFETKPDPVTNSDKVAVDKAALDIGYANGDSTASVTQNMNLSEKGSVYFSDITWASSNTLVISNSGLVTRPSFADGNASVTLIATIEFKGTTDTKVFHLTVTKLPQVNVTVTFDKNGGDTEASPISKTVASGKNVGTLPAAPTKSGYTFNGWNTSADGSGTAFTASTAVASNYTVYAQWTKIIPNGGGGGGGTLTVTPPPEVPKTEITVSGNITVASTTTAATVDNNGKASAAVTKEQIDDAVSKAVEEAGKMDNATPVVEIKVKVNEDTKTVETNLPKIAINDLSGNVSQLNVSTPVADIIFDSKTLSTISNEASGDIKITASKVDTSTISNEAKQVVGDHPVFNFSVTSGDRTISQFGGNVSVSVPYTPKPGEDTNSLVIYYINAAGKPEVVSNCVYNPSTGTITFNTNHFSQYAIGYNKVTFKDVVADAWYSNSVAFIAAREITTGSGNGNFGPNEKLTRGQFIVMLMKAYGIAPDASQKDNFADAGNTWYTAYLAAAKKLGISAGIGNNLFAPEKEITRQEMFTLLYNALKVIGKLPSVNSSKLLESFSDTGDIAPWAKDAIKLFVDNGTINGSENKLCLKDTTTRAQMAQVLYSLLSK